MARRILAIAVAIVLALVGGLLVFAYANNADQRAIADQEVRSVYVTTDVLPSGTTLREAERLELITATQVVAKGYPEGALEAIDETNQELLALADIPPGTFVLASAFGTTPLGVKAIDVPAEEMAISMQLSDPQHVGSFLTPGSRITVFATYDLKSTGSTEADQAYNDADIQGTSVIVSDIQVIGQGATALTGAAAADGEDQAAGQGYLVTVAVTPQEAIRLVHAINNWTLYLGLHGADVEVGDDSGAPFDRVMSVDDLDFSAALVGADS